MTDVRQVALDRIEALVTRGRRLADAPSLGAVRLWQQDCAALVHQLSGGSKAHWLSRAFSAAFLVRSTDGGVVVEATAAEIVDRLLDVLSQARSSVSQITDVAAASSATPRAPRFDFVHNAELRPVLERALTDGHAALDAGDARLALILWSSALEAIITDALEHHSATSHPPSQAAPASAGQASPQPPASSVIAAWSFDQRIAAAEQRGLIRGGCARLPAVARQYREIADDVRGTERPVTDHDARVAGQVLRVVMRDLDPGR
ncbi:MAG: hypothetical protein HY047_09685 [Acidobacteria bacterium]|nr:hypothetical protein [Acidobacteriota bacterium]